MRRIFRINGGSGRLQTKVVVIGIDALDPVLISTWMGELPTLSSLIREGAYGPMRSTIPPLTIPAWVSMLTGKRPAKLGSFGLVRVQKDYSPKPSDPSGWRGQYVWDLAGAKGRKVGIMGFPFLASPYPVNGFMMTDPAWGELRAIPDAYATKIRSEPASGPTWRQLKIMWRNTEREKDFIRDVLNRDEADFYFFYLPPADTSMHWGGKETLRETYRKLDGFLHDILPACEGKQVFLVSDHGCKENSGALNIPTFLSELGMLQFTQGKSSRLKARLTQTIVTLFYWSATMRLLLTNIGVILAWRHQQMPFGLLGRIDLKRSQLFPWGGGGSWFGLWVNRQGQFDNGCVSGADEEKLMVSLRKYLTELRDPKSGEPVVARIMTREELGYDNSTSFPDLAVRLKDPYVPTFMQLPSKVWLRYEVFEHADDGLFLAKGPGIKRGYSISGCNIVDVAPTLLHVMGMGVPRDIDGHVLQEVFEPTSEFATRSVVIESPAEEMKQAAQLSGEDEERIAERLKALGYMG